MALPLFRAAASAVALVLFTAACAAGPDADSPSVGSAGPVGGAEAARQLDDLYKAAQDADENQILVYGPAQNFYETAYQAFQKRYPAIRIVPQPVFGQQLITKLAEEFTTGRHAGSVQINGGSGIAISDQAKQCEPYRPPTLHRPAGEQADTADTDTYTAVARFAVGIEYNTDKIKAEDAPRSWQELADPRWKDRLVQVDPAKVGVTSLMISQLLVEEKLDEKWVHDLLANDPQTLDTAALAEQSLARGERDAMVAGNSAVYTAARAKSLPVGFVFPTAEGARFDTQYTCLIKGAPAPHASKLLIDWLHTPEGQESLAKAGVYGTRPGTPSPQGMPAPAELEGKIIPEIPADQQAVEVARTIDLVKRNQ